MLDKDTERDLLILLTAGLLGGVWLLYAFLSMRIVNRRLEEVNRIGQASEEWWDRLAEKFAEKLADKLAERFKMQHYEPSEEAFEE